MSMLNVLDSLLNRLTMYSLVGWVLRALTASTFVLSLTGAVPYSLASLSLSLTVLIAAAFGTNYLIARVWGVPYNFESFAITALILYLIMPPADSPGGLLVLALAAGLAMASKFVVNVSGRHIFNPAAFGALAVGLLGLGYASWWIGSGAIWWLTLLLGLLVVRKVRRFSMVAAFAFVALAVTAIDTAVQGTPLPETMRFAGIASPLLFLGTIMLTEPSTMPARRRQQIVYGVLVGLLYALPLRFGPIAMSPELALLVGNLYAFIVNPHYRLKLQLTSVEKITERVWNYRFAPLGRKPVFEPGQYMEWTLDIPYFRNDMRGNRRTFTIASSPTESDVMIGVKFYEPSSRFKQQLRAMKPGGTIFAGAVAGDFVLPHDTSRKLAFIAGGIGITPFRSMLKYIVDSGQQRDIVLIYAVSNPAELPYQDVLDAAPGHGVRVVRLLTAEHAPKDWQGTTGQLTAEHIRDQIPDIAKRVAYVSGPQAMVTATRRSLHGLGVKAIKTDYFTGY